MRISVALITLNEETNIEACLESVRWADEIIVVDSGSNDKTVDLAKKYTSHIFHHFFRNFAEQKNFALSKATGDWVFFIDADERANSALAQEIRTASQKEKAVYEVKRITFFFNRPLKYSGTQNDAPIRFFPRDSARFEQPVHEHIVMELPVKRLHATLAHYTTRDLTQYKYKLKQYVALELETMKLKKRRVYFWDPALRSAAKFLQLYFLKAGILDGLTGFQLAALSAYYDWLKYTQYYGNRG